MNISINPLKLLSALKEHSLRFFPILTNIKSWRFQLYLILATSPLLTLREIIDLIMENHPWSISPIPLGFREPISPLETSHLSTCDGLNYSKCQSPVRQSDRVTPSQNPFTLQNFNIIFLRYTNFTNKSQY